MVDIHELLQDPTYRWVMILFGVVELMQQGGVEGRPGSCW